MGKHSFLPVARPPRCKTQSVWPYPGFEHQTLGKFIRLWLPPSRLLDQRTLSSFAFASYTFSGDRVPVVESPGGIKPSVVTQRRIVTCRKKLATPSNAGSNHEEEKRYPHPAPGPDLFATIWDHPSRLSNDEQSEVTRHEIETQCVGK